MIIAFSIMGKKRQFPFISVFIALCITVQFTVFSIADAHTGEMLFAALQNSVMLNAVVSLFHNANILYFVLHLWLTLTVMMFLEQSMGRLIFFSILIISALIALGLFLTGMHRNAIPVPLYQSLILIMTGFFYTVFFKSRTRVLYFFFPTEFAYGTFVFPAWAVFLPFYVFCQCAFIFWGFSPVFPWVFPSDSSIICTGLCPLIGCIVGAAYRMMDSKLHFMERIFGSHTEGLDLNKTMVKGIEAYNSGDYKASINLLKDVYENSFNQNILSFLFNAYMQQGMEKEAVCLIENTVKKLNAMERHDDVFNVFLDIRHTDIHRQLPPGILMIFIRHLHRHKLFEEAREYMDIIASEHKDTFAYKKLQTFSRDNDFY